MSWVAVGAAAVSVVGGAINNNQAAKRAGKVAPYQNVDLGAEQKAATEANLANEGGIEALLNRGNAFQVSQAKLTEDALNPGFSKLRGELSDTATSLLDNPYDVPDDVAKNIERLSAERGISTGTRGQFSDFSLLRDFGISSLQFGQQRINQASTITGLLASVSPKVNPMSPLSFYVAPEQALGNATRNNENNQQISQSSINAENAALNNRDSSMWNGLTKLTAAGLNAWNNNNSGGGGGSVTPGNYDAGGDYGPDY